MSLDIWFEEIVLPVKGARVSHGRKRRGEASLAISHRQTVALHTTCGGVGIVGKLREQSRRKTTRC